MPDQIEYSPVVKSWLKELELSAKREKDFRKEGRRILEIYEVQKKEQNQFNILFSNTETLAPALYNSVPRPQVERRFKDSDPLGKMASDVTKRTLGYLIDSNDQDYSNFDDMLKSAVLEALLPGRGLTRFKYDADIEGEGENSQVKSETVCGEEVPWDRILTGYAKKWKDIPWLAFEHFMTKDEIEQNFKGFGEKVSFTIAQGTEDDEKGESNAKDDEKGELLAHVYEVWDKAKKKVIFVSPGCGEVLKESADPLGLSGFFPCPRPLQFVQKVSDITPVALYLVYEDQAKELNYVTSRINKIMRALKVRGFYDSTLTGLDKLLTSEDNTLLPTENVAAMLQGQTLEKAIWFFPIEKLVGVLQQLYQQREQIKATIYEITGVSDILRGSSQASETATAQNIKNQWGTLRLKRTQKEVMRYVRDCLRIMAEISVEKLSTETIASMTGLQYPTAQQKQQAQMAVQNFQQQAQQLQATGQQPPAPPPELAKLQQVLTQPSWDDVMGVLEGDLQRNYRIDIETNSTVDAEATEDKTDVAEFLNAMSQFLNGIAPLIEQGFMQFDTAKAMLLAIVRRFRFGTEVEDKITEMQAPAPKGPESDPKLQADMAKAKMQQQMDMQEMEHQKQMNQMELELKQEEMALKREELQMKRDFMAAKHQSDLQSIQQKAALGEMQAGAQAQATQRQSELGAQQHEFAQQQAAQQAELAQQEANKPQPKGE